MSEKERDRSRTSDLRDLPQAIAPARDLWPAIEAQLQAEAAPRRRPPRLWYGGAIAAAASVVLAIGIWIGRLSVDGGAAPQIASSGAGGQAELLPAAFAPDARYVKERERLLRDLEARLAALPPESRAQVEKSLVTIRTSIEELKSALGANPSSALLQELLVNAYQDEMRVLATIQDASRARQEI